MSWTPAYVMRERHFAQALDRANVPKKKRTTKKHVPKPRPYEGK